MGGGSACAGFASKRWLLTWSSLTLVLPLVGQRAEQTAPDLPQQNLFQQNALFLVDLWHFPGVLRETRDGM